MSQLPLEGDPVTVVFHLGLLDSVPYTTRGVVRKVFPHGQRFDAPGFRVYGNMCEKEVILDEEGTTWIRGHHRSEEEEAQALLAAYVLSGLKR